MEARARQRYIVMSPRKIRRVIKQIRGKSAQEATDILYFMPYAAAQVVYKNLLSAIANAEQKYNVSAEDLIVSEVFADEGPRYTRFKPRAQGRVYKRVKRTAHLTLVVKVNQTASKK
jgi:large subunit ribosomal protein L22